MLKYITLFFLVLILFFGCKRYKTPPDIIPHDKMISILTDIHLTDGALYAVAPAPDTLYKYGTDNYIQLFKRHKTDSVQFKKSLKYYSVHSNEFLVIYDQVMKNMKQKIDSLNKISQKPLNAVPQQ